MGLQRHVRKGLCRLVWEVLRRKGAAICPEIRKNIWQTVGGKVRENKQAKGVGKDVEQSEEGGMRKLDYNNQVVMMSLPNAKPSSASSYTPVSLLRMDMKCIMFVLFTCD